MDHIFHRGTYLFYFIYFTFYLALVVFHTIYVRELKRSVLQCIECDCNIFSKYLVFKMKNLVFQSKNQVFQIPSISIKNFGFRYQKFRNTRFFGP